MSDPDMIDREIEDRRSLDYRKAAIVVGIGVAVGMYHAAAIANEAYMCARVFTGLLIGESYLIRPPDQDRAFSRLEKIC